MPERPDLCPEQGDRILWNEGGETVDEIVVHDCTVHLEQMDDRCYWIGIYKGDDKALSVNLWVEGGPKPLLCLVEDDSDGDWPWDEDREHGDAEAERGGGE